MAKRDERWNFWELLGRVALAGWPATIRLVLLLVVVVACGQRNASAQLTPGAALVLPRLGGGPTPDRLEGRSSSTGPGTGRGAG